MDKSQIDRLNVCRALAEAIVRQYRAEAPSGCDPQNSVAIVAVAGTVVAAGVAAYSASSSASAKDAAANVPVPKYQPYTPTLAVQNSNAGLQGLQNAYSQYGGTAQQIASGENNYYDQSINALAPGTKTGLYLASKNTASELGGRIPADVVAATQRADAQAALSGGYGANSGMGSNLTARDLGRTSLDLTQMGEANLAANTNLAKSLTPYSAGDILGTSQQYLNNYNNYQTFNANEQTNAARDNAQGFNNQAQQQYQQQIQMALAPDPTSAAASAAAGSISSGLSSYYGRASAGQGYYGVGNSGYNTSGYYATPGAANAAYGAGANLGYTPGYGGGYYNQYYSGTG